MGQGKKNKFKVAVNNSRKERSPESFNRNLYYALPEEILKCDKYIDFRRQLIYLKDKVFYSLDEFLNSA